MEQLKQPNLNVVGQSGLCLVYVRNIFGIAAKYPTATSGWQNAQYKHTTTPPTDVSVPVWFSYGTDGHVAVSVPGKGFYSVSAQGDKIFSTLAELEAYIKCSYLGWSEDINGVRVVEPVVTVPTPAPSGSYINLPVDSGAWHLYNVGGPYDSNNPTDYIAIVHPAEYSPGGLTYPILQVKDNGIYEIQSPSHGKADLWTKGSEFTVS